LDYEQTHTHTLLVLARDSAVDSRTGTTTVTINVQDTQDSIPIFFPDSYDVTVAENNAISQVLVQVTVSVSHY